MRGVRLWLIWPPNLLLVPGFFVGLISEVWALCDRAEMFLIRVPQNSPLFPKATHSM